MGQYTQTHTAAQNREINLGHQEVQRIIEELIEIYNSAHSPWLPIESVGMFLCTSLGYEDMNELEDALNGPFIDFLKLLDPIVIELQQPSHSSNSGEFRVRPTIPVGPTKMTYRVTERSQLFNVLVKSSTAKIKIPSLGVQISEDGRQRIDTVYNYLKTCVLDLSMSSSAHVYTDTITGIIEHVTRLCDVSEPWELIVVDPIGVSKFSDMSLVNTEFEFVDSDDYE